MWRQRERLNVLNKSSNLRLNGTREHGFSCLEFTKLYSGDIFVYGFCTVCLTRFLSFHAAWLNKFYSQIGIFCLPTGLKNGLFLGKGGEVLPKPKVTVFELFLCEIVYRF